MDILNIRTRLLGHSINCAKLAPEGFKLEALLHDATEAYVADIVRPAKVHLRDYTEMEKHIFREAIAPKFGLDPDKSAVVKIVDNVMCVIEAYHLLNDYNWIYDKGWPEVNESVIVKPSDWRFDKEEFLMIYTHLTGETQ